MSEERGKPRLPLDCSDHHDAPRIAAPRPPRGTKGQPIYSREQIEAAEELAAEKETE
jgi:hypothetical protein